ncbi:MAG: Maf family nucleotide pyrophosphatase [Bacteroidales bacterium]
MLPFQECSYHLILGSSSKRRQDLLKKMGFDFDVVVKEVEEIYPPQMNFEDVPEYIAHLKSIAYNIEELPENALLITADTLVILDKQIFGKPKDREEAIRMLYTLSGQTHKVITGVCLKTAKKQQSFSVQSKVTFRVFSLEEIEYYIDTYKPYDKAGAYGLQEWIGYVGLEHIEGSFFNVMGLPTQRLYKAFMDF